MPADLIFEIDDVNPEEDRRLLSDAYAQWTGQLLQHWERKEAAAAAAAEADVKMSTAASEELAAIVGLLNGCDNDDDVEVVEC